MRILVALGGNALLRRGEPMTAQTQRANVRMAARSLAAIHPSNTLIVTHGNGPQIGLLALQADAADAGAPYPLDVLGAETDGAIGYMIEQELSNVLAEDVPLATLLTMIEVDPADPAFGDPTKFIGTGYSRDAADRLEREKGWIFRLDADKWRRVVASPEPKRIIELRSIRWLLEKGVVVIAAGGGGIPVAYDAARSLHGVEAVIDKDFSSELLARELAADLFIMATDTDAVYLDWGKPEARAIRRVHPEAMAAHHFPAGSMGPKVAAACRFASSTGRPAAIGALTELPAILRAEGGTTISVSREGIEFAAASAKNRSVL